MKIMFLASAILGLCSPDLFQRDQDSLRYFGTRTAYDVVRNRDITDENIPGIDCIVLKIYTNGMIIYERSISSVVICCFKSSAYFKLYFIFKNPVILATDTDATAV